jgi:hypothetical protein
MSLPRATLVLSGLAFAAFGLYFLYDPAQVLRLLGVASPSDAVVRAELSALYGGLELGLGVFFLLAAVRGRWVVPALALQICAFGGLALGRGTGMVTAGVTSPPLPLLLAIELLMLALGAIALRRARVLMSRNAGRTYF